MKKRIISLFLVLVIGAALITYAGAFSSLSNFRRGRVMDKGKFSDISESDWYYEYVKRSYEMSIFDGKSENIFDPGGMITLAETVKLASVIHSIYTTGHAVSGGGSPWYRPYLDYAVENGIAAGDFADITSAAARADFVSILSAALPDEALPVINKIDDGSIPDVSVNYSYGQAVYRLYRAGVLTGADSEGAFSPWKNVSRAEAAAIVSRMADGALRVQFSLRLALTAEEIYEKCSPAVFFIEVLDEKENVAKTGSGFFIASTGVAVTNQHVMVGASSAKATLSDGRVLEITGIYDMNRALDLALIKVQGEGYSYLELADSDKVKTGAQVYTIGSPLGLQDSFSRGIVSSSKRNLESRDFIQIDAAISSGSSGGALLDEFGRIIGVTSATATAGQNINLAAPANHISRLSRDNLVRMDSLIPKDLVYYRDFSPAPDFGARLGLTPTSDGTDALGKSYTYSLKDYADPIEEVVDSYKELLETLLFNSIATIAFQELDYEVYYNSTHNVMVYIGFDTEKSEVIVKIS